jgi:hypothetical protein
VNPRRDVLRPLKPKVARVRLFGLDLEGDGGERGFLSGAIVGPGVRFYTEDLREFLATLTSSTFREGHLYVHNLTYDLGILLPHLGSRLRAYMTHGKVFRAVYELPGRHRIYFHDSLGLFAGLPLSELGRLVGLPKYPTPPQFLSEGEEAQEWWCEAHGAKWCSRCYNTRDAEIVYRAVRLFEDWCAGMGIVLQNTLASTAMVLFRTRFLEGEWYTPFPVRNEFARQAYYGGRVEDFSRGVHEGVHIYDVNSLYPYVMAYREYPDPNALHGPLTDPDPNLWREAEGVSEVTVEVPDLDPPVLPVRYEGRLFFPVGTVRGVWTHPELRAAEARGCRVREVHASLWSDRTFSPFTSYVETLYAMRRELREKGDPRQLVVKVLLNALYGKFGQRSDGDLQVLMPLEDVPEADPLKGWQVLEFGGRVFAAKPLATGQQPVYVNTLLASYITAYARLHLLEGMEAVGGRVAYCDTDSLVTAVPMPTGDGLGAWKAEAGNVFVDIIGPKLYVVYSTEGGLKVKAKGVPSAYQEEYLRSREVCYPHPVGWKEAARRGLRPSEWVDVVKALLLEGSKRCHTWPPGSRCSRSRPWHVSELPEAVVARPPVPRAALLA